MTTKSTPMGDKNDTVIIELDRPYTLRFGNKAIKEYSALTETTMREMDDSLFDFGNQQAAAYIMIKQDCVRQGLPAPTPQLVEDLLDEHVTPARLFYLVQKAVKAAFEDEELQAEVEAAQRKAAEDTADPQKAAGTGAEA